jgi:hypothetical protein
MAMMSITYRNPGTHVPCDKWRSVATRANNWLDRLKNGHLPAKFAWVLYRLQLWSSLKYGLGTLLAPIAQMGEVIKNFAFKALPFLGVNRNIRSEYCYLHTTFGRVVLLLLSTESTVVSGKSESISAALGYANAN